MSEPYNGTPFGWAFRVGSGSWSWSAGATGLERRDAAERALMHQGHPDEPAQIARVWVDVPPGDSPIDVQIVLEHAEESYEDEPEIGIPEDGYIIHCDAEDVRRLQVALDAVWREWMRGRSTAAYYVAEDEVEDARAVVEEPTP